MKLHIFHKWTKWEVVLIDVIGKSSHMRAQRRCCMVCNLEELRRKRV